MENWELDEKGGNQKSSIFTFQIGWILEMRTAWWWFSWRYNREPALHFRRTRDDTYVQDHLPNS